MAENKNGTLRLASLLAILFLIYLFRSLTAVPPAVDPNHAFNTERAYARLARILGDEAPHSVDTDANDEVRDRLITEIEALGFTPIITDDFHCIDAGSRVRCARLQNVAFWVTEPGPNAVLVASHYDSVPAGPGASDDGAGIAASLEIAALMEPRALSRPLLILITDGEEYGLMGASLFVEKDPLAEMVGAVVNMEARGVRGLTALIQTSRPNGRDLKTLRSTTRLPAASSLNADIYELLPNDTDMTEFLALDIDAANLAYSGGVRYYHTPHDNLANLDKRALFNIGASGLAATETFLSQTGSEPESQLLFADLYGVFALTLSPILGLLTLILGAALALAVLWRNRTQSALLRVAPIPVLALILGMLLATGASMLIGAIRPEAFFGSAYPIALRGVHASAALLGALIIYTFMARPGDELGLLGSAWLWFCAIGILAFSFIQGAAIVFVPTAGLLAIAAGLSLGGKILTAKIVSGLGLLVFALIVLPLTALGEAGLFIEGSAPFTIILLFAFALAVPCILPAGDRLLRAFWQTLMGAGGTLVAFTLLATFVPAYTQAAPRPLSISHIQGDELANPVWSVFGTDKVPPEMNAVSAFSIGTLGELRGTRQLAEAPPASSQKISLRTVTDITLGDERAIALDILAPEADRLTILLGGESAVHTVQMNGEIKTLEDQGFNSLACAGRACRNLSLTIHFAADAPAPELTLLGTQFGLGSVGEAMQKARPDWATPVHTGDTRIVIRPVPLDSDD